MLKIFKFIFLCLQKFLNKIYFFCKFYFYSFMKSLFKNSYMRSIIKFLYTILFRYYAFMNRYYSSKDIDIKLHSITNSFYNYMYRRYIIVGLSFLHAFIEFFYLILLVLFDFLGILTFSKFFYKWYEEFSLLTRDRYIYAKEFLSYVISDALTTWSFYLGLKFVRDDLAKLRENIKNEFSWLKGYSIKRMYADFIKIMLLIRNHKKPKIVYFLIYIKGIKLKLFLLLLLVLSLIFKEEFYILTLCLFDFIFIFCYFFINLYLFIIDIISFNPNKEGLNLLSYFINFKLESINFYLHSFFDLILNFPFLFSWWKFSNHNIFYKRKGIRKILFKKKIYFFYKLFNSFYYRKKLPFLLNYRSYLSFLNFKSFSLFKLKNKSYRYFFFKSARKLKRYRVYILWFKFKRLLTIKTYRKNVNVNSNLILFVINKVFKFIKASSIFTLIKGLYMVFFSALKIWRRVSSYFLFRSYPARVFFWAVSLLFKLFMNIFNKFKNFIKSFFGK